MRATGSKFADPCLSYQLDCYLGSSSLAQPLGKKLSTI